MSDKSYDLMGEDLSRLYGALRSVLNELSVQNIRNTVAAAGIDVSQISSKSETRTGLGSRAEVMPAVDRLFGALSPDAKVTALCILAEKLRTSSPEITRQTDEILGRHGFQFINNVFVPVGILDKREADFLPSSSAAELARAIARLVNGDMSGAITSACGAVDLATQSIYTKHGWEDPGQVSFSAKVNTALLKLNVFDKMKTELSEIGVEEHDAESIVNDMRKATNHAAQGLQLLRRTMGDVHGSKPALKKIAYDSVKWASAICGLLEGL
jgi:hypothetical protein